MPSARIFRQQPKSLTNKDIQHRGRREEIFGKVKNRLDLEEISAILALAYEEC
jgi:hypothetical protein